jgi:hypothetical protein
MGKVVMAVRFKRAGEKLVRFCKILPGWFRSEYARGFLFAPFLCVLVVYQLADANVWGWQTADVLKATMEVLHPSLLAAGALIGAVAWMLTRKESAAFVGVICMFAFFRELGGQGTSVILYLGLIAIIIYAQSYPDKLVTCLGSRLATSLIATGFICYALSQLLDRGVIKRIGWLFT